MGYLEVIGVMWVITKVFGNDVLMICVSGCMTLRLLYHWSLPVHSSQHVVRHQHHHIRELMEKIGNSIHSSQDILLR